MSLLAILHDAGLEASAADFVKAGPRKSLQQPHCWFACDRERPRWLLKFTEPGNEAQARRVHRESEFLRAVGELEAKDPVRVRVPKVVAWGETQGREYLVSRFENLEPTRNWLLPGFERDPLSRLAWLDDALRWLEEMQRHPTLKQSLEAGEGRVIVHGDYSHYNFLGHGDAVRVIDWEDWRLDPRAYLDALHLAVMPTLEGTSMDDRMASFRKHWLEGSSWAHSVWPRLQPFLGELIPQSALADYLRFQMELTATDAPQIGEMFQHCLEAVEAHGASSSPS